MNRLRRSNSTTSTRSRSNLTSLEDIVNEEDENLHSDADLQNWSTQKLIKKRFTKPHGFCLLSKLKTKLKLLKELMLLVKIKKNVFCLKRNK